MIALEHSSALVPIFRVDSGEDQVLGDGLTFSSRPVDIEGTLGYANFVFTRVFTEGTLQVSPVFATLLGYSIHLAGQAFAGTPSQFAGFQLQIQGTDFDGVAAFFETVEEVTLPLTTLSLGAWYRGQFRVENKYARLRFLNGTGAAQTFSWILWAKVL